MAASPVFGVRYGHVKVTADVLGSGWADRFTHRLFLVALVLKWPAVDGFLLPVGVLLSGNETFDYIVVGAGAAGCAVAARLAIAGHDVLLVEAGGDPNELTKFPGFTMGLLGSDLDWHYQTISNNVSCLSSIDQQCIFSRGKTIGGSTSINYMLYVRGNRRDYDFNIPGWSWKELEPYFLKYEGLQDLDRLPPSSVPYHNTTGTMKIEFFSDSNNLWHERLIEGFKSLGLPFNPDVNAMSQIGITQVIGYVYKNERMSTARGYLAREDVFLSKLKIVKNTQCTGVIIDDDNVARGVNVMHESQPKSLYAKNEVILSAGAIGTPQLLMLSGVGPADHLNDLNIPLRVNLSVGDDMSDHVLPLILILVNGMSDHEKFGDLLKEIGFGFLTSDGLTDVSGFVNTRCYDPVERRLLNNSTECELPTLQLIHAYLSRSILVLARSEFQHALNLNDDVIDQIVKINENYGIILLSPVVLQPYSRGNIRLASSDPLVPPAIFPNFLSDERDVEEMLRAIDIVEDLVATPTFKEHSASIFHIKLPGCPEYSSDRVGYWRCYVRHMTYSVFHAVGTSAVGRVVNPELRVEGVRRLRVADLGVMPHLPRGNAEAVTIAIGEKLADLLLLLVALVLEWPAVDGFSYKLLNGVQLSGNESFDYIVVGAGAAGCAVAARLAVAGHDVLLVEAGGDPNEITKFPGFTMGLLGSDLDWRYQTISNNVSCLSSIDQQCIFARGKSIGGSTSINYMMYVRGNRLDYDLNIPGWSWKELEPYFLKYEGLQNLDHLPPSSVPYHNTTGPMKIEFFSDSNNPWHERLIEGYKSLGMPFNPDVNAMSQIGVSQVIGYVYKNERMSTARGFLMQDKLISSKLKIVKNTQCTGVIIDDENVARGVSIMHKSQPMSLYAKREIILSAGAIGTPQLLMLSGVGPAGHLHDLNIPLRVNLTVGDNMSDHVLPLMLLLVDGIFNLEKVGDLLKRIGLGIITSNGLTDVCGLVNTRCYDSVQRRLLNNSTECELPTLQFIHAYISRSLLVLARSKFQHAINLNDDVINQIVKINLKHGIIVLSPVLLQPVSRGHIRLASSDPLVKPAIFPNYLSEEQDVEEMLRAIDIVEDLVATPTFKEHSASIFHLKLPGCPEYSSDRVGYWRCYVRHMTYSVFHAVGTSAVGRVVDPELHVEGVRRLRVADLGVMPQLPRGNTEAVAIAIGEKMADLLLKS